MPNKRNDRRRRLAAAAIVVVLLLCGVAWFWPDRPSAVAAAPAAPAPAAGRFLQLPQFRKADAAVPVARDERKRQLVEQLVMADQTLCSYKQATQYPAASQPLAANPDQIYPNQPVEEFRPMGKPGGGANPNVQIQSSQSHVFLASGESVVFTIKATDREGKPLSVVITRAVAHGLTSGASRGTPQIPLSFADDGNGSDAQADDGRFTARFTPALTGLAMFNGTIRSEVEFTADGQAGMIFFDVIYTPELPATWIGSPREAVEDGSLVFYLKASVQMPGRYIVTGRVDDAQGKPFALATFNDVLPQGVNDIRLVVFGKLMHDQQPAFPLRLRDVEGYLLKENTDPDRALMPRLEGTIFVSKNYATKRFSDEEWHSEERARYLDELGKDVRQARQALLEFDPDLTQQQLPQSDCTKERLAKSGPQ